MFTIMFNCAAIITVPTSLQIYVKRRALVVPGMFTDATAPFLHNKAYMTLKHLFAIFL
jgi:hypothetical protein